MIETAMPTPVPPPSGTASVSLHAVLRRPEQVRGASELTEASHRLEHAAEYLIAEHVAGRGPGAQATREAVGLLCVAAERLLVRERRRTEWREMASWIRGAARARAAMAVECW